MLGLGLLYIFNYWDKCELLSRRIVVQNNHLSQLIIFEKIKAVMKSVDSVPCFFRVGLITVKF